jgi:tRNA 2-thiouridine synthesizing protein E
MPGDLYDQEGFLRRLEDWNEAVAEDIARREGIQLTPAHWEIIQLLREFYRRFEASPANRALVKFAARELGTEKGRSIYLMSLFPGSPARIGSKIAGLPKPDNCL